ncbi:MAG: hypothetical protein ACRD2L_06885, partial [Terriglobia bacterium]
MFHLYGRNGMRLVVEIELALVGAGLATSLAILGWVCVSVGISSARQWPWLLATGAVLIIVYSLILSVRALESMLFRLEPPFYTAIRKRVFPGLIWLSMGVMLPLGSLVLSESEQLQALAVVLALISSVVAIIFFARATAEGAKLLRSRRQIVVRMRERLLALREKCSPKELERIEASYTVESAAMTPIYSSIPRGMMFPGLTPKPWYERHEIPWVAQLEA